MSVSIVYEQGTRHSCLSDSEKSRTNSKPSVMVMTTLLLHGRCRDQGSRVAFHLCKRLLLLMVSSPQVWVDVRKPTVTELAKHFRIEDEI